MEPPSKRPRLSVFGETQPQSAGTLDVARQHNDLALKSRFEAIFKKYSHDFSDVGDEVDILTGEIIVNRGHIARMETETDTGPPSKYGNSVNVASMLRAMAAVNEDESISGPDDVLQSIETIAENAGFIGNSSTDEEDNDLMDESVISDNSRSSTRDAEQPSYTMTLEPYDSDEDSLFGINERVDNEEMRSASEDSLFQLDNALTSITPPTDIVTNDISTINLTNDQHILARFGSEVGQEVLQLLDQRQDAHIEPEWRIPIRIEPTVKIRPIVHNISLSPVDTHPIEEGGQSLWRHSGGGDAHGSKRLAKSKNVRQESEDPLQEGFSSDRDSTFHNEQASGDEEATDLDEQDSIQNMITRVEKTGECPYCHGQYATKSGVMAHWDRILKRPPRPSSGIDSHCIEVIASIRQKAVRRRRLPRLVLYDFRTMVEMHEGAGISFDEISKSGTLRSRKSGVRLQDIYDKHRTVPDPQRSPEITKSWTPMEEQVLKDLSKNSLLTMATLRRELGRPELDIGNRLAEMWLAQLKSGRQADPDHNAKEQTARHLGSRHNELTKKPYTLLVKQESDDDDLFAD